jgi:hypothetical protein
VIGFLATVAGGVASTDLTPASGCQDHTSSPSALASPVKRAVASTAPRPASVTFAKRPSEWNRMAGDIEVIWVGGQEWFLKIRNGSEGQRSGLTGASPVTAKRQRSPRHSGAMRSIEPGISRFRVWC